MSASKQVFDAIWVRLEGMEYDVYDYLPAKDVSYPFIHLGDTFDNDNQRIKGLLRSGMAQRIDIYHTLKNRNELTEIHEKVKQCLRGLKETNNYTVKLNSPITSFVGKDNSTSTTYLRGHIEVEFLVTKKLGGF